MKDRMSYFLSLSLYFRGSSLDCFYLDNNISYWYIEKYVQYIININHSLGIDAFVSQACQLSPHVNSIQALQLLQECIKIMPKTGGNSRPVGRPGWFLLSISDSFFKRAWANTFDFLPLYWQQHQNTAPHPRSLQPVIRPRNRSAKPRSSHF